MFKKIKFSILIKKTSLEVAISPELLDPETEEQDREGVTEVSYLSFWLPRKKQTKWVASLENVVYKTPN